nr:cofactor-independent phosphoglycerate mutase [uncultured Sellimonas sp.]
MKYIVILGDGMAGNPLAQLDGRTTLEASHTPVMDELAKQAEIGLVSMVPEGMAPGSDTANLSVLGYDPKKYYTGRSPLEAFSIGVDMGAEDVSFRCNLVTLSEEEGIPYEERRILDHSSDEISTEDAGILLEDLKKELLGEAIDVGNAFEFYRGTSYRHLFIWKNGKILELIPPHDILTKKIGEFLPKEEILTEMMRKSYDILEQHPLNKKRRSQGLRPANSIWFWGAGTRPELPEFETKTGKKGVMISAVDLLKGIAVGTKMKNVHVEGANGGLHTNYEGKAEKAVEALLKDGYDFAYIHVEAPDEMGHQGNAGDKILAIENLDRKVVKVVKERMDVSGEPYRMLILPDHPTPIAVRTHTSDPVPYLLYDSTKKNQKGAERYCERTGRCSGTWLREGYRLIGHLFED